ncbi:hypothetical protein [Spirochaeta isovalerica]|uniref:DNA-binding LacI/PurR family transcriptional regulator n=1 Tax=Spirochaeta isovalerica TaxID=150 RepID=A0A841R972_9SPIO|nr:hypothetical protein [Spirochaeta isovalerica]MBB6479911.1 DNA-binding LacI/PurR family transcriptional regulator [Spirochaeta isovalerica]
MTGKYTVGVIMIEIEGPYHELVCKGLESRASELEFNLLFYTGTL